MGRWNTHLGEPSRCDRELPAPWPGGHAQGGTRRRGHGRWRRAWGDREGPSNDEEPALAAFCVPEAAARREEQRLQVGEITERLGRVDDMLSSVPTFAPPPPPHIVQTLEQAHHMLIQQTTARSALTQLLPQPRVRFACGRRRRPSRPVRDAQQLALPGALQQTPTKKGRGRHAPTGALAAPVAVLGGEQRCSRQEHRQQGLRCRSLGQGRGNGGGKVHGRNRGELMLPVAVGFHALAGDAAADWPRNFRIWKAHMSR